MLHVFNLPYVPTVLSAAEDNRVVATSSYGKSCRQRAGLLIPLSPAAALFEHKGDWEMEEIKATD